MNKIKSTYLYIAIAIGFTTLIVGCGGANDNRISEGVIEYDITYPYFKDTFMKNLFPSKMTLEFKNHIYKSTVDKPMFGSTLISNCKDSTLIMMFHFSTKYIYTELDAALTDTMLKSNGIPDLIKLKATDSIAGLLCEKYMAVFDNLGDGYDGEVYETNQIGLEGSNWCNPYRKLNGVLLGYEVDQFGLQMRFRATSIKDTIVNDSIFFVPSNYKKVPLERMLYEIEELFNGL